MKTQLKRSKPPSEPTIVGMAVATIVPSMAAMKLVASAAANTHGRFASETVMAGGARTAAFAATGSDKGNHEEGWSAGFILEVSRAGTRAMPQSCRARVRRRAPFDRLGTGFAFQPVRGLGASAAPWSSRIHGRSLSRAALRRWIAKQTMAPAANGSADQR